MTWLLAILFDDELCVKLEVDLAGKPTNLHAFFRRECTLRQLFNAAAELDSKSVLHQEWARREYDLEEGQMVWDEKEQLTAGIFNVLQDLHYMTAMRMWASQKKPKKKDMPEPPKPLLPPGWKPPKPKMNSIKEGMEFFANLGRQ